MVSLPQCSCAWSDAARQFRYRCLSLTHFCPRSASGGHDGQVCTGGRSRRHLDDRVAAAETGGRPGADGSCRLPPTQAIWRSKLSHWAWSWRCKAGGNLAPAETAACNPLTRHPGARRDLLGGAGEIVGRAIAAHGSHPGRVHLGCGRLGPKMPNAYGCDSVPLSIEGIAAGREPHPRSLFVTSV